MTDNEGWTMVSGPKHRQRTNSSADNGVLSSVSSGHDNKADTFGSTAATATSTTTGSGGKHKSTGGGSTASTRRYKGQTGKATSASSTSTETGARTTGGYRGRARLTRPAPCPGARSSAKHASVSFRSTTGKQKSTSTRATTQKTSTGGVVKSRNSLMMEGNGVEGTNPFAALPTEQSEDATSIQETRHANDTGTTTATANDDDEDNDHDLDSQVDDSSSDVESENGVEPPPESFDAPVMVLCPFPGCASDDPEKESELPAPFTKPRPLVAHLETAHGLHVRNLHHMYFSLQRYLDHYAAMMRANNDGKPVADGIKVETKDGHLIWTIDPDQCHDDLTFRRELQREKLNEILQVQEKERQEDGSVPRKCLFCKVIPENRHLLFKHMFQEHGFNIGLPDNLVEVEEFLNLLSAKLTNRQCLYCEKIFTTPAVLRKHMRKKKHFKISARNRIYDKYYVINYLEPGLNWETLEYEKYESDEERRNDDNSDWDDWDEPDVEPTQCLFCDSIDESPEGIIEHMTSEHQFNLVTIREEHDLDFYKTVTLINFIRERSAHCTCMGCATSFDTLDAMVTHMKDNDCFNKLPGNDNDIWKDPKYLFPTVENDPLLMWVDDADEMEEVQVPVANNTATEHANPTREEDEDDGVEVVLGVKGEQTRGTGQLFTTTMSKPLIARNMKETTDCSSNNSNNDHDLSSSDMASTTTTITITRPRRFSQVEGVVPEQVDLNTSDVPDLSEL